MTTNTTNLSVLRELADRCEREAATSNLNIAIAEALGWKSVVLGYVIWRNPSGRDSSLPNYVGSFDAAVTLIPDGLRISLQDWRWTNEPAWIVSLDMYDDVKIHIVSTRAKTAALALCAAALRARAALNGDA